MPVRKKRRSNDFDLRDLVHVIESTACGKNYWNCMQFAETTLSGPVLPCRQTPHNNKYKTAQAAMKQPLCS